MNITIRKSDLYNALNVTARAISSNSPQPALRGIKIDAKDDQLTITGSDSDISIQKIIKKSEDNGLNILENGSVLIDAKYLIDIVRKIDGDEISIEIIDGSLTRLAGGSAEFKINGMNADDYPVIDFSRPENYVTMKSSLLNEIIDETVFAASTKETRLILTGVNFNLDNHILTVTATDSYRLARKVMEFESEGSFRITIPARSLNDVKGTMLTADDQDIVIAQNDKKAQFWNEDTVLQTKLLDGTYPETDRLIPKEFHYTLMINRTDFVRALDRTSFIRTDNMPVNRLQLSDHEIILTNRSQEIGESHEDLFGKYEGDPLDISFSGTYAMQAANALKGENIKIEFTGPMKPFVITSPDDTTILQLVLPVRTYN